MIDRLKADLSWWWHEEHGRLWVFPLVIFALAVITAVVVTMLGDKAVYGVGLFVGAGVFTASVLFVWHWIKSGSRF